MNLTKREIIPDNIKEIIDEILEEQLLNANRNYAEDNKEIYEIIERFIKIDSQTYIKELKKRWDWHNSFYEELLEPAYKEIINSSLNELTPKQVNEFIKIYNTCINVDKATMITSCGIKKHLDYWKDKISLQNEDHNPQESLNILLTPLKEPFYIQYRIDHIKYVLLKKSNSSEQYEWKKYLLDMYHANDEIIFTSRYKRDFQSLEKEKIEDLVKLKESYEFSDSYKARYYYFMLEHPERKAFNDIISYDNLEEKLLAFQLIGISGFLYRKEILKYLNDSNILKNDGFIYAFSDKIVTDALEKLLAKTHKSMSKNVKVYNQTRDTCAIVCMLSVLEYYKKINQIDLKKENSYFEKYKSRVLLGTPLSAVAYELSSNDLDVCLYHSSKNIFENKNNYLPKRLFCSGMKEYKDYINLAEEKGTKIENGKEINSTMLLKELKDNKMIILAGNSGMYLHAILVCGYDENNFIVFDPLYGKKKKISHSDIERYMDTNIGKWCITVQNKTLKKDKLIDSLSYYDKTSEEKIKNEPTKEKPKQKIKR